MIRWNVEGKSGLKGSGPTYWVLPGLLPQGRRCHHEYSTGHVRSRRRLHDEPEHPRPQFDDQSRGGRGNPQRAGTRPGRGVCGGVRPVGALETGKDRRRTGFRPVHSRPPQPCSGPLRAHRRHRPGGCVYLGGYAQGLSQPFNRAADRFALVGQSAGRASQAVFPASRLADRIRTPRQSAESRRAGHSRAGRRPTRFASLPGCDPLSVQPCQTGEST